MALITLKKRLEFVQSNKKSIKYNSSNFIIQILKKKNVDYPCFGFTITKKIGTAVVRNKIKRRLKSIIRLLLKDQNQYFYTSYNYVLICKKEIVRVSYDDLINEMRNKFKLIKNINNV